MGEHGAVQRGKKKTSGVAREVAVQAPKPLALGEAAEQAMSSHQQWKRARLMGSGSAAALQAEPAGFLAAEAQLSELHGLMLEQ